jgi:hypothetical protein
VCACFCAVWVRTCACVSLPLSRCACVTFLQHSLVARMLACELAPGAMCVRDLPPAFALCAHAPPSFAHVGALLGCGRPQFEATELAKDKEVEKVRFKNIHLQFQLRKVESQIKEKEQVRWTRGSLGGAGSMLSLFCRAVLRREPALAVRPKLFARMCVCVCGNGQLLTRVFVCSCVCVWCAPAICAGRGAGAWGKVVFFPSRPITERLVGVWCDCHGLGAGPGHGPGPSWVPHPSTSPPRRPALLPVQAR